MRTVTAHKPRKKKLTRRYGHAAFRARTGIQVIADETAAAVISESTRAAIEKMAEDFARDMLADKEFRHAAKLAAWRLHAHEPWR